MIQDQSRILLVADSPTWTWYFGRVLNQAGMTTDGHHLTFTVVGNLSDVDFNINYDCIFVIPGNDFVDIARLRRMCRLYRVVLVVDSTEESMQCGLVSDLVEHSVELLSLDDLGTRLDREFILYGETAQV